MFSLSHLKLRYISGQLKRSRTQQSISRGLSMARSKSVLVDNAQPGGVMGTIDKLVDVKSIANEREGSKEQVETPVTAPPAAAQEPVAAGGEGNQM